MSYNSGSRFVFQAQTPENQQLMGVILQMQGAIQQMQQQLQDKERDREVKLIETDMKEDGANRRKAAELETRITEKTMDLMNPVPGEQIRQ